MQQLRELYERQDTEELLEIAKKDLTDEARTVMNAVLAERGIDEGVIASVQAAPARAQERATQTRLNQATRTSRLLAFAIDVWGVGGIIYLALLPLGLVVAGLDVALGGLFWTAYLLLRDGIDGRSIGKLVVGIRTISVDSGRPCNWFASLMRNLPQFLFIFDAIFILGERQMRLGDILAGTQVMRFMPVQPVARSDHGGSGAGPLP